MLEIEDEPTYCKNCQNDLIDEYCNKCGQRASVHKITFKETLEDFLNAVFSVDAPLWSTLKLLFVNPGKLFREYLGGRRKSYYKPVAFFILTTILYLLIRSLISYDPMENELIKQEGIVDATLFLEAGKFMVANINNIMFLLVFALGLFFKLFFLKRNSLAEFMAISFYLVGIYTIFGTLIMFYLKYVNPEYKMLPILVFSIYILFAFISFFKTKNIGVMIKIIIAFFLSFIFYAMLGYALSLLIVWLKTN